MKKEKIVKTTIKKDKSTKKQSAVKWEKQAEYRCMKTYQMMPAISQTIDRYFHEFLLCAQEDEELYFLRDFLKQKGVPKNTWMDWKNASTEREELHFEAMEYIGMRRERGAFKRQLAEKTIHFMMPLYSEDWKKRESEQAKLGIIDEKPQTINIVMESYKDKEE